MEECPEGWKESIILPRLGKVIKQMIVIIGAYLFVKCIQICIQHPSGKVNSICTENVWDHQCGFLRNSSATDHIFCVRQILEKKCEYNGVNQLFIEIKKAYDSAGMEALYNILIQCCVHTKLVRLIKMCLNVKFSRFRVGKYLFGLLVLKNVLKKGDVLSPLYFNFALEYAIRKVQVNHVSLKLRGTHQLLIYVYDVNTFGRSIHTVQKNTEDMLVASMEIVPEVNAKNNCIRLCLQTRMQDKITT